MPYDHKKIEKKWQKEWGRTKIYETKDKPKAGPPRAGNFYALVEFPYPSGEGLHMGHLRPYVAGDVYSRYLRTRGKNVLFPIGWDAFGLPAENFAIKRGVHPSASVEKNVKNAKRQIKEWGISFDWSREINTTAPEYYRWTQWIFLQIYKAGLAYEATGLINWCPKDKTGLADEEVVNGCCERCGAAVEQKEMKQWYLKITAYAEKLLLGLKNLDWPEKVKIQQENWIGKSEGAVIKFEIRSTKYEIEVFTTRPDTLFGATYVVLAPEHPLIENLKLKIENWNEVKKYLEKAKKKTQLQRQQDREKTGAELKGIKAVNPANNEEIPIWVADYVLTGYGTGAIMAVPAHDQRDFEFAQKFSLPIKHVIIPAVVDHVNPPREDKSSKRRINVHALVYDPARKKYLIIRNEKFGWDTVVIGGVEEGENLIDAALREIKEETGYTDLELKRILGGPVQATYFAKHKDENRVAVTTAVCFELKSDKRVKIDEDGENDGNEILWVDSSNFVPGKMVNSELPYWLERLSAGEDFVFDGKGVLINSGSFDGMDSEKAKWEINKFVGGEQKVQYKLRDWVFSRQRYWGEPIPIIHCSKCGTVPVPDKDLPVLLPYVEKYKPAGTGESPLASIKDWVNVKCPKCCGPAKRETNTMPQWAGSSWYYLRYIDPKNKKQFADKNKMKQWLPVDAYFGGMEHTTLHLLYSRFWHLFLYDQSLVSSVEPYQRRIPHGLILGPDGEKMSKSRGNIVSPDEVVEKFGADALRMYEMFLGPHDATVSWKTEGIVGIKRFLDRVWAFAYGKTLGVKFAKTPSVEEGANAERLLHKTIKKVGEDIENFRFNTTISALMVLLNEFEKEGITHPHFAVFLKLLAPFAPHIAEEIWHKLGNKKSIHLEKWPQYDPKLIQEETFQLIIQVNGKVRDKLEAPIDIAKEEAERLTLAREKVKLLLDNKKPRKVIFVPKRLINIVV